jgi:hypothetical protein
MFINYLLFQIVVIYSIIRQIHSLTTAQLVSSVQGELEAGNYTHYLMYDQGDFKLVLQSLYGDADLYVSDKHRRVDFDNYDWQSITYGDDEVYITEGMSRPVAISVYAHPYYPKSKYSLNRYLIISNEKNYDVHNMESNENFQDFYLGRMLKDDMNRDDANNNKRTLTVNDNKYDNQNELYVDHEESDDENESILWTILIHLLKLIAEIVL